MDPAITLVCLCSLEDHIKDFLDIDNFNDLPDFALINFFCYGLNNPLQSTMIRDGPPGLLSEFLDYTFPLSGSPFTVGQVEENASPKHFFAVDVGAGNWHLSGPDIIFESGGIEYGGLRGSPTFDCTSSYGNDHSMCLGRIFSFSRGEI